MITNFFTPGSWTPLSADDPHPTNMPPRDLDQDHLRAVEAAVVPFVKGRGQQRQQTSPTLRGLADIINGIDDDIMGHLQLVRALVIRRKELEGELDAQCAKARSDIDGFLAEIGDIEKLLPARAVDEQKGPLS